MTRSMKDISNNMRYAGNKLAICNHYCNAKPYKTKFYKWFTYLGMKFIKEMCEKCALREVWGYNYKQTKNYKNWIEG